MSGGSFDYLCFKSPGEVIESAELTNMLEVMYREFPDALATQETAKLLAVRDELKRRVGGLQDVWQSIEWWRSCDTSRESAAEAIQKFEAKNTVAI